MISEKRRQEALTYGKETGAQLLEKFSNPPYYFPKDETLAKTLGEIASAGLPGTFPRSRTYNEITIKEMRKIAKGAATRKVLSLIKNTSV